MPMMIALNKTALVQQTFKDVYFQQFPKSHTHTTTFSTHHTASIIMFIMITHLPMCQWGAASSCCHWETITLHKTSFYVRP